MAKRLSFCRMSRRGQRLFSQASAVLGLLLVTSLAHGAACASPPGAEAPGLRAADQDRCLTVNAALDACIVLPQRTDARVAAAAPTFPEPLPAAGGTENAARISRAAGKPQSTAGLAPATPVPAYILLRRYLS